MSRRSWIILGVVAALFIAWRWSVAAAAGVDLGAALLHPFASALELCPLSGNRARCESMGGGPTPIAWAGVTAGGLHPTTAVPAGQAFSPQAWGPYV